MSNRAERLRAELALAEAEEAFAAAKAKKDKDPAAYVAAKYALRELRQAFRQEHRVAPSGPGDAAPAPAVVDTKVSN